MEEQLELIQRLREDVSRLVNYRDETKEKYDNIEIELDKSFESIREMNCSLESADYTLNLLVENKAFALYLPLSIAVTGGIFIFFKIAADPNFHWSMLLMASVMCEFVILGGGAVLTKLFYNKIEKYLINKYPHIKKVYDKVNSLTNERNLKEQSFMKMRKEWDELKVILKGIEEQLEIKREELDSVEKEYFDSLIGKSFINEDENHHTIGIVGRGKTKVRIPENKDLSN